MDVECIICRSPIIYHREQRMMTCHLCGRIFMSNAECSKGHYVCDGCHSKAGIGTLMERCLGSDSKNPVSIAIMLMSSPDIHMHGPEHHVLIGSALLTAYSNSVDGFDLQSALKEMKNRGRNVRDRSADCGGRAEPQSAAGWPTASSPERHLCRKNRGADA